ncbi:MAG: hypothetical protein CMI31_11960 [Opitutae bacterium]|nr:hypothetical protein [Opitutae bacterium]|tara:strand:- start:245 stop:448 length:204 start_codon:yes stop_codon:yes gene_type:complete
MKIHRPIRKWAKGRFVARLPFPPFFFRARVNHLLFLFRAPIETQVFRQFFGFARVLMSTDAPPTHGN